MGLTQRLKEAYTEAGVTPEQITALEAIFTDEEILKKLEGQHMKNADYTQSKQQIADEKRKLEAERKRLEDEYESTMGSVNQYKTDLENRLTAAVKQTAASRTYGAALESKLQKLALEYGADFDELMADVKEQRGNPEEKKDTAPDEEFNKRFVSRDEYQGAYSTVLGFAPMIRDFERDYQKTFGKEYEGSITDLIRTSSEEVQKLQQRGQKVDLFGHIRQKLDFAGQQQKNTEAAKTKAEEERKQWEAKTREEIERDVRSKVLVENPRAYVPEPQDAWRQNLSAKSRGDKEAKNQIPVPNPMETVKHRQSVHETFNKLQEQRGQPST